MTKAVNIAQSAVSTFGFKNRIINGDMRIDQRNAGASVTPTNGQYLVDRFVYYANQASKFTAQQNAGAVALPNGFTKYLGFTSASAYSIGASDQFLFGQVIEGLNMADLAWGTANAKTVTLSFQAYSSLTGTFGGFIKNGAGNRFYVFSYSIPVANTWTTISITLTGDTSGSWAADNSAGMYVLFSLGAGSSLKGTAGSWSATTAIAPTGSVDVVSTNGATFYITGVQLEVGSTATSFDVRDYGRELIMCQRYFETNYNLGTPPGTITNNGVLWNYLYLSSGTVSQMNIAAQFRVTKRAQPTMTWYSPDTGASGVIGTINGDQAINNGYVGTNGAQVFWNTTANNNAQARVMYTASAEL